MPVVKHRNVPRAKVGPRTAPSRLHQLQHWALLAAVTLLCLLGSRGVSASDVPAADSGSLPGSHAWWRRIAPSWLWSAPAPPRDAGRALVKESSAPTKISGEWVEAGTVSRPVFHTSVIFANGSFYLLGGCELANCSKSNSASSVRQQTLTRLQQQATAVTPTAPPQAEAWKPASSALGAPRQGDAADGSRYFTYSNAIQYDPRTGSSGAAAELLSLERGVAGRHAALQVLGSVYVVRACSIMLEDDSETEEAWAEFGTKWGSRGMRTGAAGPYMAEPTTSASPTLSSSSASSSSTASAYREEVIRLFGEIALINPLAPFINNSYFSIPPEHVKANASCVVVENKIYVVGGRHLQSGNLSAFVDVFDAVKQEYTPRIVELKEAVLNPSVSADTSSFVVAGGLVVSQLESPCAVDATHQGWKASEACGAAEREVLVPSQHIWRVYPTLRRPCIAPLSQSLTELVKLRHEKHVGSGTSDRSDVGGAESAPSTRDELWQRLASKLSAIAEVTSDPLLTVFLYANEILMGNSNWTKVVKIDLRYESGEDSLEQAARTIRRQWSASSPREPTALPSSPTAACRRPDVGVTRLVPDELNALRLLVSVIKDVSAEDGPSLPWRTVTNQDPSPFVELTSTSSDSISPTASGTPTPAATASSTATVEQTTPTATPAVTPTQTPTPTVSPTTTLTPTPTIMPEPSTSGPQVMTMASVPRVRDGVSHLTLYRLSGFIEHAHLGGVSSQDPILDAATLVYSNDFLLPTPNYPSTQIDSNAGPFQFSMVNVDTSRWCSTAEHGNPQCFVRLSSRRDCVGNAAGTADAAWIVDSDGGGGAGGSHNVTFAASGNSHPVYVCFAYSTEDNCGYFLAFTLIDPYTPWTIYAGQTTTLPPAPPRDHSYNLLATVLYVLGGVAGLTVVVAVLLVAKLRSVPDEGLLDMFAYKKQGLDGYKNLNGGSGPPKFLRDESYSYGRDRSRGRRDEFRQLPETAADNGPLRRSLWELLRWPLVRVGLARFEGAEGKATDVVDVRAVEILGSGRGMGAAARRRQYREWRRRVSLLHRLSAAEGLLRDNDRYHVISKVGEGPNSIVYLVVRKDNGARLALKYIEYKSDVARAFAIRQCEIVRDIPKRHPSLLRLADLFVKYDFFAVEMAPEGANDDSFPSTSSTSESENDSQEDGGCSGADYKREAPSRHRLDRSNSGCSSRSSGSSRSSCGDDGFAAKRDAGRPPRLEHRERYGNTKDAGPSTSRVVSSSTLPSSSSFTPQPRGRRVLANSRSSKSQSSSSSSVSSQSDIGAFPTEVARRARPPRAAPGTVARERDRDLEQPLLAPDHDTEEDYSMRGREGQGIQVGRDGRRRRKPAAGRGRRQKAAPKDKVAQRWKLCAVMPYSKHGDLGEWISRYQLRPPPETSPVCGDCSDTAHGEAEESESAAATRALAPLPPPLPPPAGGPNDSPSVAVTSEKSPGAARHPFARHLPAIPECILASIAFQINDALHFLHTQLHPLLHGNVKTENILITSEEESLIPTHFDYSPRSASAGVEIGSFTSNSAGGTPSQVSWRHVDVRDSDASSRASTTGHRPSTNPAAATTKLPTKLRTGRLDSYGDDADNQIAVPPSRATSHGLSFWKSTPRALVYLPVVLADFGLSPMMHERYAASAPSNEGDTEVDGHGKGGAHLARGAAGTRHLAKQREESSESDSNRNRYRQAHRKNGDTGDEWVSGPHRYGGSPSQSAPLPDVASSQRWGDGTVAHGEQRRTRRKRYLFNVYTYCGLRAGDEVEEADLLAAAYFSSLYHTAPEFFLAAVASDEASALLCRVDSPTNSARQVLPLVHLHDPEVTDPVTQPPESHRRKPAANAQPTVTQLLAGLGSHWWYRPQLGTGSLKSSGRGRGRKGAAVGAEDMWALGCVLYALATGHVDPPQRHCWGREAANDMLVYLRQEYRRAGHEGGSDGGARSHSLPQGKRPLLPYQMRIWKDLAQRQLSPQCITMIMMLLSPFPDQRLSSSELSTWFRKKKLDGRGEKVEYSTIISLSVTRAEAAWASTYGAPVGALTSNHLSQLPMDT